MKTKNEVFEALGYKDNPDNSFAHRLATDMAEYPVKKLKSDEIEYYQERYTHQEACMAMSFLIQKVMG